MAPQNFTLKPALEQIDDVETGWLTHPGETEVKFGRDESSDLQSAVDEVFRVLRNVIQEKEDPVSRVEQAAAMPEEPRHTLVLRGPVVNGILYVAPEWMTIRELPTLGRLIGSILLWGALEMYWSSFGWASLCTVERVAESPVTEPTYAVKIPIRSENLNEHVLRRTISSKLNYCPI